MIARTPAAPASSTPSGNGKNASEANTAPAGSWPCWRALCTARKEASTRLICPAPIPIAASSRASSTALDLTLPTAPHAKRRSRHSSAVGGRRVTTFHPASSTARRALVRLCGRAPERDAARRGVLDDGAGDAVGPRGDRGDGGVHVEQIVERQLLAVQLPQVADAGLVRGVERGPLVRVLPVTQRLAPLQRQREPLGPGGAVLL